MSHLELVGIALLSRPQPISIHRGGRGGGGPVEADLQRLAERAAHGIGLDLAGMDLLVDRDGSPYLLEVNYAPGFRGLEQATGLDVAATIVRHPETEHPR